jgi:antitoxin component HigA of HigAB toxin-antitoxin module
MTKIKDKLSYHAAMAEIEAYLAKGFSMLTTVEGDRLEELSKAVENWELKEYPMPAKPDIR